MPAPMPEMTTTLVASDTDISTPNDRVTQGASTSSTVSVGSMSMMEPQSQSQSQSQPQSQPTSLSQSEDKDNSTLIGIVVGSVGAAFLIAGIIAFVVLRNRCQSNDSDQKANGQSLQVVGEGNSNYGVIPQQPHYDDVQDVRS